MHTVGAMNDDLWKQWQGFFGLQGTPAQGAVFAPHIQAAERFSAAARRYFEQAAGAPGPAAADAVRGFGDFLRTQSAELLRPLWSADFGAGAAAAAAASGNPIPPLAQWPALGLTREHQQRWQRAAEAARRTVDAQNRLQLLWSDALREAAGAFAAQHASPPPAQIDADYLRRLYDSWIDCAEEAYARTAHGSAFCDALAEFVNASSQWRNEVQAGLEHFAKSLDLPTRSEINSLARRLKDLEERVAAGAANTRRAAQPKAATDTQRKARAARAPRPKRAPHAQRAKRPRKS